MPLAQTLQAFKDSVAQCDNLISNAHKVGAAGAPVLPALDQRQITVAAFLNMFIAWETFLESSLIELMTGAPTISGRAPVRYVMPVNAGAARELVIWIGRYFDFANHQNMIKAAKMYFENGYPFEPHLSSIYSDLDDLRTMRNASAHVTSTTQTALDGLALRILGSPRSGINLYELMTIEHPQSTVHDTVYAFYKIKLIATAEAISQG